MPMYPELQRKVDDVMREKVLTLRPGRTLRVRERGALRERVGGADWRSRSSSCIAAAQAAVIA
jgi:hypothetical protein